MLQARRRGVSIVILLALGVVPLVVMLGASTFYVDLFTRVMIFAIAAISLDFVLGYGGLGGFNQAGYLGVGAYAVGILGFYGIENGWVQFGTAVAASALVALAIGAVSLRTGGIYFIMITLAFGQMLYFLGVSLTTYGGDDGMTIAAHSDFGRWIDLGDGITLYYVIFAALLLCLWGCGRIVESRFGMVLRGIMINERRLRALGVATFRYKLAAFMISGALCGVAGALLANQALFVSPAVMHWARSGEILMMVIVGGMGTLFGPVLGAIILLVLEDTLSGWTEHWQLYLGPILLVIVLVTRRGLFGPWPAESLWVVEPLLETRGLVKRFGGLLATDHVSLSVLPGEFHAVIGPNGAGKTTLVAQLSGELPSDKGTTRFDGGDVTRLPVHRRARLGLTRSFQITNIFGPLSTLDNVALAVQARAGHSFRFWRPARRDRSLRDPAAGFLAEVGLEAKAAVPAEELSHGEKRALEIAMALATRPRLLLLDEPMAGMGPEDSQRMIGLLGRLKGSVGILLVEHDMDAVFALADRITVLVYGRAIASGSPAEIRTNPEVRTAYLGEE